MTDQTGPSPVERRFIVLVPLLLIAVACASTASTRGADRRSGTAAYVLDGSRLSAGVPLWASLSDYVPGLRVFDTAGGCPAVTLRRGRRASPIAAPLIYVDGARTYGTCALAEISPWDVDRVEVYPGGVSHRPGYRTHATGLILIFLKRS